MPSGSLAVALSALFFLALAAAGACASAPRGGNDTVRIGVASCANERLENPFWRLLRDRQPDMVALLGDNVYADHPGLGKVRHATALRPLRPT